MTDSIDPIESPNRLSVDFIKGLAYKTMIQGAIN